jgi:4-hydroxybenzoate polyprenyltransferase
MLSLRKVLKISRPRFWFYTFGTFLIGWIAGLQPSIEVMQLASTWSQAMLNFHRLYIIWLLLCVDYFVVGANILIYGVNDLADEDTDQFNDKKWTYEHKLQQQERSWLKKRVKWVTIGEWGAVILILSRILRHVWYELRRTVGLVMLWFWLTGIFYSMEPIRAKAKPFLDGIFNVLYIVPSMLWWLITHHSREWFGWYGFIAGWLRAMAMHAYSAIPDIQADSDANLTTTAVYLGADGTLIYCW